MNNEEKHKNLMYQEAISATVASLITLPFAKEWRIGEQLKRIGIHSSKELSETVLNLNVIIRDNIYPADMPREELRNALSQRNEAIEFKKQIEDSLKLNFNNKLIVGGSVIATGVIVASTIHLIKNFNKQTQDPSNNIDSNNIQYEEKVVANNIVKEK